MLILFLAIFCIVSFFTAAIAFNRYLLIFLPIVVIGVLAIFNMDLLTNVTRLFFQHSLFWAIPLLLLLLFLTRRMRAPGRVCLCTAAIVIGCVLQFAVLIPTTNTPVSPLQFDGSLTEAAIFRHQGGGLQLNTQDRKELQDMLAEIEVERDITEKSMNMTHSDDTSWYSVSAVLEDGRQLMVSFFPRSDEPDLMRIDMDNERTCYQAVDADTDIGSSWINQEIEQARRREVKEKYREPLSALKQSFTADGTSFSFTLPADGLPNDLEIIIIGLPGERNSVIYFLDEYNEENSWTAGEQYSFDVSEYGSYRYLYLSAVTDGEKFSLINLFDYLPEEMKSSEPQDRFTDSGI